MILFRKSMFVLGVAALCACSHQNPLKQNSVKEAASFLMNASANVEKRLHFPIPAQSFGFGYLECMEGKHSKEINCPELFKGIVAFAKENHYPAFKSISLADLNDKAVFDALANDYAEVAASSTPSFFMAAS